MSTHTVALVAHRADATDDQATYCTKEHIMTHASFATAPMPSTPLVGDGGSAYQPGVCNIGPAEIARRRRAGHVGLGATVILGGGLVAVGAPPLVRLLLALPAAVAASGYLQARLCFCAGFGSRGVFNFGPLGQTEQVQDNAAHARDRARANQIGLASLAIGLVVGALAVVLPL